MHFHENGKDIENDLVEKVYRGFEGITLYLQMLMNEIFLLTERGGTATADFLILLYPRLSGSRTLFTSLCLPTSPNASVK